MAAELLEQVRKELTKVTEKWDRLSAEMLPLVKAQAEELKAAKQDRDRLRDIDAKLQEYGPKLMDVQSSVLDLKRIVAEMEKGAQRGGSRGEGSPTNIGRAFVDSEVYKSWKASNLEPKLRPGATPAVKVGGNIYGSKAAGDMVEGAGGVVWSWRRPDAVEFRKRRPVMMDWIPTIEVGESNKVDYEVESAEYALIAICTATAAAGQKDVAVNNYHGIFTGTELGTFTSGTNSGSVASIAAGATEPAGTLTMLANLTAQIDPGDLLVFPNFDFIAETNVICQSMDVWAEASADIYKSSSHVKVSVELLEDSARTEDRINRRLLARMARMKDKQILYGPGGSGQVEGFYNNASIQTVTWSSQPVGTTKLDLLLYAITIPALAEYDVEAFMLHPNDYRDVMLTKGSDGHYAFAQVQSEGMPARVWGVELVRTTATNSGDSVGGEFSAGATIYQRTDSEVMIGTSGNDMLEDKRTIVGRERYTMVVEIPAAFVIIDFDAAPTP